MSRPKPKFSVGETVHVKETDITREITRRKWDDRYGQWYYWVKNGIGGHAESHLERVNED